MTTNRTQLYQPGRLEMPGSLLLKTKAYRKEVGFLDIEIYQKGLIQISSTDPSEAKRSLPFDFDVKYSIDLETYDLTFEFNMIKSAYNLKSETLMKEWRSVLKNFLNQRGFHEQFKAIKKIGKGNFASVYLAEKYEDKSSYAVKAFCKEAAYSEQNGKECLIKQIEIMRCLDHKNTMKLYQVFESDNSLYIIFELLQGGQLYDKVKEKYKFKQSEIQAIIYGILLGLREMHSKRLMHRDLKPENLLFRKNNDFDCVIADFGLSEFADVKQYLFVRCGTPGYVAPEVINIKDMKSKYDPICDMFSLGLIFHLLLLGKNAFPGTTYNEVLKQNRAANVTFTQEDYNRGGQDAMDLLAKMLKTNPLERISAQLALKHSYFAQNVLEKKESEFYQSEAQTNDSYPGIDSPLLTTSNTNRKADKNVKKDSCVDFKMGKDNMLTGKVDTVGAVGSKFSGIIDTVDLKKAKLSAFCKEK